MEQVADIVRRIDEVVWGPLMLTLMLGTSIYLTVRLRFLPWRRLGYALRSTFTRESRQKSENGDISPFSALTTALAATIGTGNIVGVATAMVAGGPGALVWMWISALFGLSSKYSECMLSVKYRRVNEAGEMSGGPMYTMERAFRNRKLGRGMGWCFAFFAVIASFGIGNMTQSNSISEALGHTFGVPARVCGVVFMVLALCIMLGGIRKIAVITSVVVPVMAVFYMAGGIWVILGNASGIPEGLREMFLMAFSPRAVCGGVGGTITASLMQSMRFGVARGIFSNEAGMGSAAITAAAAAGDSPVRQGYINMTGTFWDTLVVCSITGLCIASSGVLGTMQVETSGTYRTEGDTLQVVAVDEGYHAADETYTYSLQDGCLVLRSLQEGTELLLEPVGQHSPEEDAQGRENVSIVTGLWRTDGGERYRFGADGTYYYGRPVQGAALTILAFETVLGKAGGWMVSIGIVLFAFATILGWEYQGEKAFEYMVGSPKYHMAYRLAYGLVVYVGATTALDLVWNFSDIANALMAIPNLICLLALSGTVAKDTLEFSQKGRLK